MSANKPFLLGFFVACTRGRITISLLRLTSTIHVTSFFNAWPYLLFCYPVEVNRISNHLFQNLFDWCLSLIYTNPSAYKRASPEIPLCMFSTPNCNTTKLLQCFPAPPNHTAVMRRMQFKPGEESARGNKRFWMQSWGLVGWREFQGLFPPVKCLCNCYPDIYIFTY